MSDLNDFVFRIKPMIDILSKNDLKEVSEKDSVFVPFPGRDPADRVGYLRPRYGRIGIKLYEYSNEYRGYIWIHTNLKCQSLDELIKSYYGVKRGLVSLEDLENSATLI